LQQKQNRMETEPAPKRERPKYQEILELLRQSIQNGELTPGNRLPSEADLVEQFHVSRITVARALNELELKGLVERRAGAGTFVVEPKGKTKTKQFGLLIPALGQTEIFEPICQGMSQTRHPNLSLIWGQTLPDRPDEEGALSICRDYVAKKVDGVFFAPVEFERHRDRTNRRILELFSQAGIAVVLLDRDVEAWPKRSRHDLVAIDNRRAGFRITDHLIECGASRLTFVSLPESAPTVTARVAGFREAIFAHGMAVSGSLWQQLDPADRTSVDRMLNQLRPNGIVCANDSTAAKLMLTLEALGMAVPDQIRVGGIDDVRYAELLRTPLTTIRQPCQAIGAEAINVMLERLQFPDLPTRDVLLDFELVVRQSCGYGRSTSESRR
jgi:GntR family transcriptional regulator, arabinose operon transcriptional repressor